MIPDPARFLRSLFDRAVEVADPMRSLARFLPDKPKGRLIVIGAGKASARMAEAVEAAWGPCQGLVITRYGYARPCRGIEIACAAHPVPDQAGVEATQRMLNLLQGLTEDDFVLALISGGASALLCAPAAGMTLAEKQAGQRRSPRLWRADRGDEHRQKAPEPGERRPAFGRRPTRPNFLR